MSNPYLDRVVARMQVDDAVGQLHRHWAARGEKWLCNRPACWLERVGLLRCADLYVRAVEPLAVWFGHRQAVFLQRWL